MSEQSRQPVEPGMRVRVDIPHYRPVWVKVREVYRYEDGGIGYVGDVDDPGDVINSGIVRFNHDMISEVSTGS